MIDTVYSKETISKEIHTKWAGKTVHFAKETDSTNEWCKRLSKEGAEHGTLAVTEFQSAGKGRLGRRWTAPEGSSIMMSVLLRPDFEPQYASMLTLVMGLSVAQAVRELDIEVSIKWPNDIYWNEKKICGILIENDLSGHHIGRSISGIGVNINQEVFRSDAPNPVSLKQITREDHDRYLILANIMKRIKEYYTLLQTDCSGKIADLINTRYAHSLFRRNGFHRYADADGEFIAHLLRVEPDGRFILEDQTGKERGYLFKEVQYIP